MRRHIILYILLLLFSHLRAIVDSSQHLNDSHSNIKHVIILMLENRSFDHMLGHLKNLNKDIRGLDGTESNPFDPDHPDRQIRVSFDAPDRTEDVGHQVEDVIEQMYGTLNVTDYSNPTMNGFVKNARRIINDKWAPEVMKCFNFQSLPVISTLAKEFALFDMWFSSVAGPTIPNRMYLHSATSHGLAKNRLDVLAKGLPQKTIYQSMEESGYTWRAYYKDFSELLILRQLRKLKYIDNFRRMKHFEADVLKGNLPTLTFISPRYFSVNGNFAEDQHPDHSIAEGESLIKYVYETLRSSPIWNSSALIILYDEHGGFYDHMPPPTQHVPNPDGLNSTLDNYDFQRLGIRIPAIVVSPWVDKQVVHEPDGPTPNSQYDHTSVHATLKSMFGLKNFLTKRDQWSGSFDHIFRKRTTPRVDCPLKLPDVYLEGRYQTYIDESKLPLNDLQKEFLAVAESLAGVKQSKIDYIMTQHQGGEYIDSLMRMFFLKQQDY